VSSADPQARPRVYADNNATTRPDPRVLQAMAPYLSEAFGNASSVHSFGRAARGALDGARDEIARLLHVEPGEVVLTASGSEANAIAVQGAALSPRRRGTHIVASRIEHSSVLESLKTLGLLGIQVDWIAPEPNGQVDPKKFAASLRDDTALAVLMLANNETGVIQPLAEVGRACEERRIPFHVDAVQALGKIQVIPKEIPCDTCSCSGHKIHGPKGAGALFVRRGISLRPLVPGHQERGRRGGTEDVAAAVGFATACRIAVESLPESTPRIQTLRDRLEERVRSAVPDVKIYGDSSPRVVNTSNFGFPGADGEAVMIALDMEGIAVSTGAACSSGSLAPSHVLLAMGVSSKEAHGSIRVSLSRETTDSDVDAIAAALARAVARAR
jgi:cysteine desulfurase